MIYDNGCTLTGFKCGINMKFIILLELDAGNCIQVCRCIGGEYIQMNGECSKKDETMLPYSVHSDTF